MNILIITSYFCGDIQNIQSMLSTIDCDYVVACDGGLKIAESINLKIDLVVGDFDSYRSIPSSKKNYQIITLPCEKDYSDFHHAILEIVKKFPNEDLSLYIIGGIGGRFDHTLGNIQSICSQINHFNLCTLLDYENTVHILNAGDSVFQKPIDTKFGLISLSHKIENLTITGARYTLTNGSLSNESPIGISNFTTEKNLCISFSKGILALIFTNEKNNNM